MSVELRFEGTQLWPDHSPGADYDQEKEAKAKKGFNYQVAYVEDLISLGCDLKVESSVASPIQ